MPEPEEACINRSKEQRLTMDLDLDLDNSWPLDQISFFSNPTSPFLLSSSSDQPSSPLWAFSDAADDFRPPPSSSAYPIYLTCNTTNSATEIATVNDDNRKFHPPLAGLLPTESLDSHCIIKERMALALRYFKESTEQHVLAQVWTPVKKGGRYVLTTLGQPFILDPHISGLNHYRMVSLTYMFSVDGENDVELGLPGRVFRQKLPEWTPDVQYYSSKEYSRLDHALHYNVRGTLALPVFEHSGELCVGVLELIMTSQKINYAPEVDKVCKALEAVNLKSSEILDHTNMQICNEGRKNALAEILEILTVVCETHKLPLAQTWVPCMHGSVLANGGGLKKSCTSFDGSCSGRVCMSTTHVAFYVVDGHMWGFREACLEHHLQKGQGVAGRAFLSHNSCFCPNITQSCKTQYPLVHYARMFGLKGSFAICLRSGYTGDDDYILEFFLPPSITNIHEQKSFLGFVLATIKQHFRSLKVASGMDLEDEEGFVEVIQFSEDERIDLRLESVRIPPSVKPFPVATKLPNGGQRTHLESLKPQSNIDLGFVESERNISHANGNHIQPSDPERKIKKQLERKRGKTEKSISLEVLQQYFAGSLKDAAKSLGVCPTTMKRICRQHGISRWPSRKINKVNRSLSKLKRVIESVHGAEGAFSITPLGASPLPGAVGSISWNSNLHKGGSQHDLSNCKSPEHQSDRHSSPACKTAVSNGRVRLEDQLLRARVSSRENLVVRNGSSPEVSQHSNRSKSASGSGEGSVGAPTSHGSCQGSPAVESTPCKDLPVSPIEARATSPEMVFFPTGNPNVSAAHSIANSHGATEALKQLGAMLVEDAGSSKDLRNLCPSVADAIVNERTAEYNLRNPPCSDVPPTQTMAPFTEAKQDVPIREESRIITIKATYKEDIIRFRITLGSGIIELKEEVGKRFKLDVGTFDIKYLDDDHEWVLIACDADLLECVNISRSSGSNLIRLSVHDTSSHHGSSCESTEEL